jgi:serine/threonine-protein kinase
VSDIFLSYAREDKVKAKHLAGVLVARGWSVWWDPRIPTGRKYRQVIDEALVEDKRARQKEEPSRAQEEAALDQQQRAQREAAERADRQRGQGPRRVPIDWRRATLVLALLLLGSLVLVLVLRVPKGPEPRQAALEKARQATAAAEEQTRRAEEARRVQEQQAAQEKARQATAAVATPASKMVKVPAGEFWMGCNEKVDQECDADEKPGRSVSVDAFSIDRTEVTVAQYRDCVEAGRCTDPATTGSCNWGQAGRDDHPVNCVDWSKAKAYCEWAGKRLPTEAEWEKAARGTDGRKYPWGNDWSASKANVGDDGTKPVGSYPSGASPYGAVDMAGNVWEWVSDKVGDGRGLRGGSWNNNARLARASNRFSYDPDTRSNYVGFRCAQ